ncbi:SAC3/GANP/Nin1/mts3/eIF-3 p25 [Ostreococcus tauri]|uniref:SAC3/GANP/Nin1/mts3/eIF-3 p25 n=1 Tax=Ostreococcus tauri TaxID=70448 RepID=A0A090N484_OSTTA|nr:SAC3/GANP/Nin1/mts3/eIF-3 p25 [Ostreococcus tauri]CEF99423.1 SAC3/GANP/Nin1/mts3/eIF-3 p25 [Ostreococcus tauri]|eukprot:XP_022839831.1 SAC3/GANP/Nin1/mts3/eIF-3 p25 [Ostreococcus tauri]
MDDDDVDVDARDAADVLARARDAVERYARPCAGERPRPPRSMRAIEDALETTLAVSVAAERAGDGRRAMRAFVDDRARAVRQDLGRFWMDAADPAGAARATAALERMVTHDARRERAIRRDDDGWCDAEAALREEQGAKTLGMLCAAHRARGGRTPRAGEFASLFLCARAREVGTEGIGRVAGDLRRMYDLGAGGSAIGVRVLNALGHGNHRRFFELVESDACAYEHACVLERMFPDVRVRALEVMNAAMNSTPMSTEELARVLRLDRARDAADLADACGLAVDGDFVSFRTKPFTRPNMRDPDVCRRLRSMSCSIVDAKLPEGERWYDAVAPPRTDPNASIE